MAAINLVTADKVRVVESIVQITGVTGETNVTAGHPVRYDTAGRFIKALANNTTNMHAVGVNVNSRRTLANMEMTAIVIGVLDGWDFTTLVYGTQRAYLADGGGLADAAGTQTVVVGKIIAGHAQRMGYAPDKLLYVNVA